MNQSDIIFISEMNQSEIILYVGGDIKYANIGIESTQIVNKSYFEFEHMFITITICLMTIVLNMAVMKILWKEEKTIINQLMILDSMVNIVSTFLVTFQQSPYFRGLGVQAYCYPNLVVVTACIIFNRLLPVSIAFFRYI